VRYEDAVEFLESLHRRPFVPSAEAGLDRAAFLLRQLGDPQRSFRVVHVAGSTGKGSTSTMIAGMLRAAGFRTGEFRSPHLAQYTERVAVDGEEISRARWSAYSEQLIPIAQRMEANADAGYALGRPTLFELLFALAALCFRDAGAEWAVLEAGLGGRLDATNLIQSDVAVITNISLEHTQTLGSTIPAIAREKAAIIKPQSSAVTAAEGEALEVIETRAAEVAAPLQVVGRDVSLEAEASPQGQDLVLRGGATSMRATLHSAAKYQAINAATAFAVALALRRRGVGIGEAAIRAGIEHFALPGRYEVVPGPPRVLLDGAHNLAGMLALANSIGADQNVLLFAAMDDKDIEGMARAIAGRVERVVVTPVPGTVRSAGVERMRRAFAQAGREAIMIDGTEEAVARALKLAGAGSLLVTGSLYLVGHVREFLSTVTA
jgi:dihydrofolate synthase/folylpolyglutamate synthase